MVADPQLSSRMPNSQGARRTYRASPQPPPPPLPRNLSLWTKVEVSLGEEGGGGGGCTVGPPGSLTITTWYTGFGVGVRQVPCVAPTVAKRGTVHMHHVVNGSRASWTCQDHSVQQFVCWLLNVPATCECISGTDLLRQVYVLPH